jgi:hypothetical protein
VLVDANGGESVVRYGHSDDVRRASETHAGTVSGIAAVELRGSSHPNRRTRGSSGRAARIDLRGGLRKTVLLIHIVAGGTWFGLDVAMAVLIFTAIGTDDPATRGYALQSLGVITVWPMLTAAVVSLVTGVVLGLGSRYGLLRYWWVMIKLVINLALAVLIIFSLRGEIAEVAGIGRQLAAGQPTGWDFTDLLFPPIVSPTALTVAFVLSIFKPWGPIRSRKT